MLWKLYRAGLMAFSAWVVISKMMGWFSFPFMAGETPVKHLLLVGVLGLAAGIPLSMACYREKYVFFLTQSFAAIAILVQGILEGTLLFWYPDQTLHCLACLVFLPLGAALGNTAYYQFLTRKGGEPNN